MSQDDIITILVPLGVKYVTEIKKLGVVVGRERTIDAFFSRY